MIKTASRLEFQRRLVEELLGVQPGGGECKQPVESCGSDVERELEVIAADNGWLRAGSWQVPAAVTPRLRERKGAR